MPTLLTLLDRFDPLLFGLIYEEIENRVDQTCRDEFEEPKLVDVLQWLQGPVTAWVCGVYEKNVEGGAEEARKLLKPTFTRFEYHVHKTMVLLRCVCLLFYVRGYS